MRKALIATCLCLLFSCSVCLASDGSLDYLDRFEDRVTEFTLENGMRFVVVERHQAPVASFVTFVDAGSVNEPRGKTGLAHVLEHMAFKGTPTIGTTNWSKEKPLLKEIQRVYARIRRLESVEGSHGKKLEQLRKKLKALRKKAGQYVKPNGFSRIIEQEGGVDLNAATSADYTMYQCSLPANKAELWFYMESRRLRNPVWREFFTERQVVLEERRSRVESNPIGRLIQQLTATAYSAHPYGSPTIGWTSDLKNLGPSDLQDFYERFYRPGNITVAVAGDVDPGRIRELARRYFGGMSGKDDPLLDHVTAEPEQEAEMRLTRTTVNQPAYARAYHSVARSDSDAPALDCLARILAGGRTSRLYQELVQEKRIAAHVSAFNGYPGYKYPSLFVVFAVPIRGVGLEELEKEIEGELERIRKEGVDTEELQRARTAIRAELIRGLDYNLGLAKSFAQAEGQLGDWRRVFTYLDRVEEVTPEQVRRAAETYLRKENMTVAKLVHEDEKQTE
ncbi:MAG: insulinase family protein [Desulfohalobiaceae bacterium]|nr:insulinase family protein [Desulfohalobiaceae bacterium]